MVRRFVDRATGQRLPYLPELARRSCQHAADGPASSRPFLARSFGAAGGGRGLCPLRRENLDSGGDALWVFCLGGDGNAGNIARGIRNVGGRLGPVLTGSPESCRSIKTC